MSDRQSELEQQLAAIKLELKAEGQKPKREVADRLKFARKRNTSYTQTDIADFLGITRTQYTNMEIGSSWITVKNLIRICRIIKTTPNEILGFK